MVVDKKLCVAPLSIMPDVLNDPTESGRSNNSAACFYFALAVTAVQFVAARPLCSVLGPPTVVPAISFLAWTNEIHGEMHQCVALVQRCSIGRVFVGIDRGY